MKKRIIFLVLGVAFLPFIIKAIMITISQLFINSEPEDYVVELMGTSGGFAVGFLCLLAIEIKLRYRIILALIYWPIMNFLMVYWGLMFVGCAFDLWL